MKRLLSFLLILMLAISACAFAESPEAPSAPVPAEAEEAAEGDDSEPEPLDTEDEGDDSEPKPLDMMDDEEEEPAVQEIVGEMRILKYGNDGEDVKTLQTRLKELQYYRNEITGHFGEQTQKAVEVFQEDFGLEVTGVADLRTLSTLYAINRRPLRYNSVGDDVKELQTRLTELGYFTKSITGRFLENTRSAVKSLQKKNGLEQTGVADPDLLEMIMTGKVIGKNDKPDDSPTPAPDLARFLVDDNAPDGVRTPDEPVYFSKKLKRNSSGKLVKDVQERLKELGYYEGPVTGNYNSSVVKAVSKLQTQNGIEDTGVVDEVTWNLIFNDSLIVLPGATPKPTPPPPFHIVVDVANQVTSVYGRDENGEYTVPVRQMLCSTGMKATPSDVGDWVLNGRHATWCIFPKWGNSYARYWTRINGSIAFHSPIYTAVSNSAMKIGSYNKLGQRASHGCIRLSVWDAKWIYDNVGKGTVVSIIEGMEADPELRDALKLPPLDKKYCTPIATPEPTAEPAYSLENRPVLAKDLHEKSNSPEVYWVQQTLKDLGYYTTKCTGKMLARTVKAVKTFQRDNGLYPDGRVNQKLIDLMADTALAVKNATPAPEVLPEATPAP